MRAAFEYLGLFLSVVERKIGHRQARREPSGHTLHQPGSILGARDETQVPIAGLFLEGVDSMR
jgi:hypothetical protein